MPRWEQGRREKAGKVRPGGAWERKTGLDAPPGAEKKRKGVKSEGRRGKREKQAGMPRRERERREKV